MNNFKITYIKIENFRAIQSLETEMWDTTTLLGDNETGKSTFASALTWCLFGKDVENNTTFEIVPTGGYGELSPCVTLECKIEDRPATICRLYKACKARDGSFTEYKTVTSVNGLEMGVRKFQEWISTNICNEQVFKILSNPKTFVEDCPKEPKELMWQAQRRLIMSIINDNQTDSDIASASNKWSDLVDPFKRYGDSTAYLAYLKKAYSDAQKQLDAFLVRIEQQEKNLIPVEMSEEEIQDKAAALKKEYNQIKAQKEQAQNNAYRGSVSEVHERILQLREEEENLRREYSEKLLLYENTKSAYQKDIDEIVSKISEMMQTIKTYSEAIDKLKSTVVVEVCSTCGQKLTQNAIRNSKLNLEKRIKTGMQKTEELMKSIAELNRAMESKKVSLKNLPAPALPVRIEIIRKEVAELKEGLEGLTVEVDVSPYDTKLEEIEKAMNALRDEYSKIKQNQQCQDKIDSIRKEQQDKAKEISDLQRMLDITKEFISQKCKESEDKINSMYKNVRFKLFEQNKTNDEIKETCIIMYNGHRYQDLSASTKIVASLELVKAFQEYYNVTVPCIIDNTESITDMLDVDGQSILMYVSSESCPKCNGDYHTRKKENGMWECKECGHEWVKHMTIRGEIKNVDC